MLGIICIMAELTQSNSPEVAMPVQERPSASFSRRYEIKSAFLEKRGSSLLTASSWLLAENSEGIKCFTPARRAQSINFFCSPNAAAPTAEMTASWPRNASTRSRSVKSDGRTEGVGKVASLPVRVMTVTIKVPSRSNASKMILPMLPLAYRRLVPACNTVIVTHVHQ